MATCSLRQRSQGDGGLSRLRGAVAGVSLQPLQGGALLQQGLPAACGKATSAFLFEGP
eukprot:symbB.v1.2.037996.t1/scaffold5774.1/size23749/1